MKWWLITVVILCFTLSVIAIVVPLILFAPQTINSIIDSNTRSFSLLGPQRRFAITLQPTIKKTGNFQNVLYYCPKNLPKTFQQMIAIKKNSKEVIAASNSFLTDALFVNSYNEEYEKRYGVYGGLMNTYALVKSLPIQKTIEDRTIMMSNSFTGTNSGHDLGTLFASLIYIDKNNLGKYQLGIQELAFKFPRILEILELFYTNWIILDFETTYEFKSVDFIEVSPRFIIDEYKTNEVKSIVSKIKQKSEFYMISQGALPPKNTKILLLKQTQNTSARTHDAFCGVHFFAAANEQGWIILNPEFDDMRYMICLLSTASHIMVSFGSIMWTHMLFFNPEAKVIHLQVGNETAYNPVAEMKYFSRILITDTNLDGDTNRNILTKIAIN